MINKIFSRLYITARNIKYPYYFISLEKEILDTKDWISLLPRDCDAVVGIPRAGLIIAGVISEYLELPLSTSDNIINGIVWNSDRNPKDSIKRILLVDDSIGTGKQMDRAEKELRTFGYDVITATLYLSEVSRYIPDYYYKKFKGQPVFGLGIMHSDLPVCSDLDGVICEDYAGQEYESFLSDVRLLNRPAFTIQAIITARLNKYRKITEVWLEKNKVHYSRLYMRESESENPIWYKSRIVLQEQPRMYWESDISLARGIQNITGVPTICFGRNQEQP